MLRLARHRAARDRRRQPLPGRRRRAQLRRQRAAPARGHRSSDIWIQPAAGDAGGALGAALAAWHQYYGERARATSTATTGCTARTSARASRRPRSRDALDALGARYQRAARGRAAGARRRAARRRRTVVGWFQGRMEFGPRALGARSILGDPRSPKMQSVMNLKIKFRESFRPFAPAVLRERVGDCFELDRPSPYMLLVAPRARGTAHRR